jgi:small subunit ribosomal protein S9
VADTTSAVETDVSRAKNRAHEYTTESEAPVVEAASGGFWPGAATGRRKQAIARVRIVPGSGQWKINGPHPG